MGYELCETAAEASAPRTQAPWPSRASAGGPARRAANDTRGAGAAAEADDVRRASASERTGQAVLAGLLALALALGLILTPSPTGTDTHTQLGLPPCGMLVTTGKPCPTCGVTTSFVLAAHGRFWDSLVNQPFGFVLFLISVVALGGLVVALLTGRSLRPLFYRVSPVLVVMILVILLLASWGYKWSTM